MTRYLSNRNGGGQTDEQGHYRFQTKVWQGNVLSGLAVTQNSPLARSVLVGVGDLKIDYNDYAYTAWHDTVAGEVVSIATADTSNPRLDRIVAYIDRAATPSGTNNPGILKFMAVAGTPGAVPVKINDAGVQSAVVAGNPWCELAVVRVEANATTIANAKITDTRTFLTVLPNVVNTAAHQDLSVTLAKLAAGSVDASKLASSLFGWELLGRVDVTGSPSTNMDTGVFTPKKHMRVFGFFFSGGAVSITAGLRFNNDGAGNYNYKTNENGSEAALATNQVWFQMGANTLESNTFDFYVPNVLAKNKPLLGWEGFSDPSVGLFRNQYQGLWKNTSAQVNRVNILATTGAFQVGSGFVVVGKD